MLRKLWSSADRLLAGAGSCEERSGGLGLGPLPTRGGVTGGVGAHNPHSAGVAAPSLLGVRPAGLQPLCHFLPAPTPPGGRSSPSSGHLPTCPDQFPHSLLHLKGLGVLWRPPLRQNRGDLSSSPQVWEFPLVQRWEKWERLGCSGAISPGWLCVRR